MKKYIELAALALIVIGCEKENIDNTPIANNGVMRIEVLHPSATRATETAFENGDVIGLYATTYNGEQTTPLQISGNWINNEALTYDGSSWLGRRVFYWAEGTMDVYGYYPYMEPTTITKHKWAVQTDQSATATDGLLSAYEASDFLWAKDEGVSSRDGAVQLKFKHMCSKVIIKLVKGEKYTDAFPDDIEVYLYSTVPEALINFTNGIVSKDPHGTKQKIKARKVAIDTFEVIVVPQGILEYSPFIEIIMSKIAYMTEEIFTYHAGKEYIVSITLNNAPSKIEISVGGSIGEWEE